MHEAKKVYFDMAQATKVADEFLAATQSNGKSLYEKIKSGDANSTGSLSLKVAGNISYEQHGTGFTLFRNEEVFSFSTFPYDVKGGCIWFSSFDVLSLLRSKGRDYISHKDVFDVLKFLCESGEIIESSTSNMFRCAR